MLSDKASPNREPEYKELLAGVSKHKGAPVVVAAPVDASPVCNVDPYQDPAYNQPHALVENVAVENVAVGTPAVAEKATETSPHEAIPHEATPLSPEIQACIDECFECHKICLTEAMHEGSETGEMHANPNFFRLMINCAEICQTSANFLLTGSPLHGPVCDACAQTCEALAQSCDEMGDLDACAAQCRKCAASCRKMAQMTA